MSAANLLADRFEEHRSHLRAVAYRLLGSLAEADDAVQHAWLRLSHRDAGEIENLGGWLTTVVSRICLDMLRSRRARPEARLDTHLPDPIVTGPADAPTPDDDLGRQRQAADAFFAATRTGDFDALVALLDPDVVLQSDGGEARPKASTLARGAATIAKRALLFRAHSGDLHPVLVNGAAGALVTRNGEPITLFAFTVRDGRIVRLDILGDPARLAAIPLPAT